MQGIPYLMDIPYLGVLFRRSTETIEETELLITVRPELGEAMNCEQVPPVGPGVEHHAARQLRLLLQGLHRSPLAADARPRRTGGGLGPMAPVGPVAPMGPGRAIGPGRHPGGGLPPGAVPDTMEEIPGQPAAQTAPTAPERQAPRRRARQLGRSSPRLPAGPRRAATTRQRDA